MICSAKSVNDFMSASEILPSSRPRRESKATLNASNARCVSYASWSPMKRGAGSVAAPVHRSLIRQTAQGLRRHRPFQRVKRNEEARRSQGVGVGLHDVVRVAEVPGEAVEVGEDMAGRARRLAVARGEACVVQERPPLDHLRRLGVVQRVLADLVPGRGVDHLHRIVEAGQHIEAMVGFVERHSRRAATADLNVMRGARARRCRAPARSC